MGLTLPKNLQAPLPLFSLFYIWDLTSYVTFHHRIWDLSLEKDEEEEAEFKAKTKEQVNAPEDLPPQLLFIHQVCPNAPPLYLSECWNKTP